MTSSYLYDIELQSEDGNIPSIIVQNEESGFGIDQQNKSYKYYPATNIIKDIDISELQFVKAIGKGSFGVVHKAIWNNQTVAVKIVETENEVLAFENEIRQLMKVQHENIIQMFATGKSLRAKCLIMEFAADGSLYEFLHCPPYSRYDISMALGWLLQCAKAIAYMHSIKPKPIIHRDLKPLNMLLTDNKKILKICDFGTACDLRTVMTDNRGSTAWMAPEVIKGCNYTEKCDVYSWGMILWELMTRRIPFEDLGQTYRILWQVVHKVRPPLIQGCPKPIEWLLKRCWLDEQSERPTMKEVLEVISPLYKLMSGSDDVISYSTSTSPNSYSRSCSTNASNADCDNEEDLIYGSDNYRLTQSEKKYCLSDNTISTRNKDHNELDSKSVQIPEIDFERKPISWPIQQKQSKPEFYLPLELSIPNENFAERDDVIPVTSHGYTISQLETSLAVLPSYTFGPSSFGPSSESVQVNEDSGVLIPKTIDACHSDFIQNVPFPDVPKDLSSQSAINYNKTVEEIGSVWQLLDEDMEPSMPLPSSQYSQEIFNEHKKLAHQLLVAQEEVVFLNQKKNRLLKSREQFECDRRSSTQHYKDKIRDLTIRNETLRRGQLSLNQQIENLKRQYPNISSLFVRETASIQPHSNVASQSFQSYLRNTEMNSYVDTRLPHQLSSNHVACFENTGLVNTDYSIVDGSQNRATSSENKTFSQ